MTQYNVKHKGVSVGLTFSKEEALSWCSGPDYKIHTVRYKK